MSRSPHDALFKNTFSDPRHAEGALRSVLPEGLARRFAWATLERVPGTFVDAQLKDRHTDLLFRVERVERVERVARITRIERDRAVGDVDRGVTRLRRDDARERHTDQRHEECEDTRPTPRSRHRSNLPSRAGLMDHATIIRA